MEAPARATGNKTHFGWWTCQRIPSDGDWALRIDHRQPHHQPIISRSLDPHVACHWCGAHSAAVLRTVGGIAQQEMLHVLPAGGFPKPRAPSPPNGVSRSTAGLTQDMASLELLIYGHTLRNCLKGGPYSARYPHGAASLP